jgi:transposase-like protein
MRQKSGTGKAPAEQVIKDIRRATRKQYGAEEKIRIVLEGLRGEESIAALCRREGIAESLHYNWSKEFLEAGKKRLAGDTAPQERLRRRTPAESASESGAPPDAGRSPAGRLQRLQQPPAWISARRTIRSARSRSPAFPTAPGTWPAGAPARHGRRRIFSDAARAIARCDRQWPCGLPVQIVPCP